MIRKGRKRVNRRGRIVLHLVLAIVLAAMLSLIIVFPGFAAVLFYIYFSIGFIVFVFGSLAIWRDESRNRTLKEELRESLSKAGQRSGFLTRFRIECGELFRLISKTICWFTETWASLVFYKDYRRVSRTSPKDLNTFLYMDALHNKEHHYSLFALSVVVIYYGTSVIGINYGLYGFLFMLIVGMSVSLRHVNYLIGPAELPAKLRRTTRRPYLVFLGILLTDFATIVFVGALLLSGKDIVSVSIGDISNTIAEVFGFRKFYRIFLGDPFSLKQIAIGLAGLFFYLGFLRYALKIRDFSKNDEDVDWLVSHYMDTGQFKKALAELKNLEEPTISHNLVKAGALLGLNRLEEAIEVAEIYALGEGQPSSAERIFGALAISTQFEPIPAHSVLSLLKWAINQKVSDAYVMDALGPAIFSDAKLIEIARDVILSEKEDFPLTACQFLIREGRLEEASGLLDSAISGSEIEEVTRLTLKLQVSTHSLLMEVGDEALPEVTTIIDSWMNQSLPKIQEYAAKIGSDEIVSVVSQLMGVQVLMTLVEHPREQELSLLIEELSEPLESMPDAAFGLKALRFRAEEATKKM